MAQITLAGILPEDLDENDTYQVPIVIDRIGSNVLSEIRNKDKITVVTVCNLEEVVKDAFFYKEKQNIKRVEIKIGGGIENLENRCFHNVDKLMIPSFAKEYKKKKVFATEFGKILELEIEDKNETHYLLTLSSGGIMDVAGKIDMRDGILYNGIKFSGSFQPRKPERIYAFVITNTDKKRAIGSTATIYNRDLSELQKSLQKKGLR